jgi:hypothetical protein
MNVELLTCRRLSAALLYPPIPLPRSDLALLFSVFSERFEVSSLTYLPDGARFAQGETEIVIQQGRARIDLAFFTHFQGVRDRAADALRLIADRLNLSEFLATGAKIIALQPAETPADLLLERNLLGATPDRLAALGPGRQGIGFRFNFERDALYDLRIEPYFADKSQIYIELDVNSNRPFSSSETSVILMNRAYDYLLGEVREFLGSLTNP